MDLFRINTFFYRDIADLSLVLYAIFSFVLKKNKRKILHKYLVLNLSVSILNFWRYLKYKIWNKICLVNYDYHLQMF